MTDDTSFNTLDVELATGVVSYLQGGEGPPLLWLHHSWGNPGVLSVHQELARSFSVIVPDLPGWGGSVRPTWARTVRDIAILIAQFADRVFNEQFTLVGTGFGGYVAAELACTNTTNLNRLVLIGSAGIQAAEGEITDQMMLSHRRYIEESFLTHENYVEHFGEEPIDEVRELWDHSREMTARVTWKPYMFNRRLAELLKNVATSTDLVWGDKDAIIPVSVADQFQEALPHATKHIIENAGHLVEIEQSEQISKIITDGMSV